MDPGQSISGPSRPARSQLGPPWPYPVAKPTDYCGYNNVEGSMIPYACHPSSQEATDPATVYAGSGPVRQWQPGVVQLGHSASNIYDEGSNTRTAYDIQCLPSTPATGDSHSAFPGLGALASSLPPSLPATLPPSMMSDRLLPNPRSTAVVQSTSELPASSIQTFSSENPIPIKSDMSWPERCDGLPAPVVVDAENPSLKQVSIPPDESKAPYGYTRARAQNTAQSVEHSTSSELAMNPAAPAAGTLDEQMMPTSSFGANSYTYSLPSGSKRPSASENALLNDQKYEALPSQAYHEGLQHYHHYYHHHRPISLPTREHADPKRSTLTTVGRSYG